MDQLSGFLPNGASFDLAIIAATISILIGGISFGMGIGLQHARIRLFGQEELAQGIVSAAMVGGIFAFYSILNAAALAAVPPSSLPSCPRSHDVANSPFGFYECHLEALSVSYAASSSALSQSALITGFASSLKITDGNVSAQPFFALEGASRSISAQSEKAGEISALSYSSLELAELVRVSALAIFLPVGLLLRAFFATRRLGAAVMAIAVSAFMVYPLLFMHTYPISTALPSSVAAARVSNDFNAAFSGATLPEFGDSSAVKAQVRSLSNDGFPGRVSMLLQSAANSNALPVSDLLVFPAVSIIVSLVTALELYGIFSARIFVPYLDSV